MLISYKKKYISTKYGTGLQRQNVSGDLERAQFKPYMTARKK